MPSNTKQVIQPYALPTNGEIKLGSEDSWTNVMDRKEKKRIQNRVAQRSYRHRMKARLGELQSQLECYESQSQQQQNRTDSNDNEAEQEPATMPPSVTTQGSAPTHPQPTTQPNAIEAMTPRSQSQPTESPAMAQFEILQQLQSQIQNLAPPAQSAPCQPQHVDPKLLNVGQPVYAQPSQVFNDPQYTAQMLQLLEKMNSCTNLLAQRDQLTAILQNPGGLCTDSMQSMDHSSASYIPDTSSNRMDFDWGPSDDLCQWKPQTAGSEAQPAHQVSLSPRSITIPESAKTFTTASTSSSTTDLSKPSNQQHSEELQAPSQSLSHQAAGQDSQYRLSTAGNSPEALPRSNGVELSPPPVGASLDERLEWMMECGEAAGFDSFDCLATAYYGSTTLAESSSYLAGEQHLSRSRRLPKLLADLFAAAQSWSAWEQRGFHEEVLKTAEAILASEERNMREQKDPAGVLHAVFECGDGDPDNDTLAGRDAGGMKRLIQSEMPNLWALVTALTTGNKSLRQRDRSGAALATIVLLHCVGRVPKQKLLRMLDSFL